MPDTPVSSPAILRDAKIAAGGLVALLLAGAVVVLVVRALHAVALADATEVHALRYVTTVTPTHGGAGAPLTLPGTLQGITESTLYARSSGYVLRWTRDIGASVNKGDLLAQIAAPEIDQELSQAVAASSLAAAGLDLAKSSAERWQSLRLRDAVTQQEVDERLSAYRQAEANLAAAQANVARLRNLQGFNHVTAPFSGVVTRRNIDVGDLVDAGNGGAGKALFSIAQVDPLRLYVYVPQSVAHQVRIGDAVSVTLAEHAGAEYQGSIVRTARAIDSATRTMQVEIRVPNPHGTLIAGSYVQVHLPIKDNPGALLVPTNVLLFRPDGPHLAVVDAAGHVRLSAVKLGTDFGNTVAILSGVAATDRVILNPADSLADGDVVTLPASGTGGTADASSLPGTVHTSESPPPPKAP